MNVMMLSGQQAAEIESAFPGLRTAIVASIVLSVFFFVFQILAVIAFFNKKSYVPKLMIYYLMINLILTAITSLWTASVLGEFGSSAVVDITKALVIAAIWIPYFLISKRVENTFV